MNLPEKFWKWKSEFSTNKNKEIELFGYMVAYLHSEENFQIIFEKVREELLEKSSVEV